MSELITQPARERPLYAQMVGRMRREPIAQKYKPSFWQRFATRALEWAERFFLHAHGWNTETPIIGANRRTRAWVPPDGYPFKRHDDYVRSHAVNAQKQAVYNAAHGGTRRDPDFRS